MLLTSDLKSNNRSRSRWGVSVIGLGLLAFTAPEVNKPVPGVIYEFTSTTSESDPGFAQAGKTLTRTMGRVRVAGDRARIDFTEVSGPSPVPAKGEGYMLVHEGGEVIYMVDPKEKQYIKMSMKDLGSMFSTLSNLPGGMLSIEVKNAEMNVKKLGAGESLLGYSTEKWEINQAYTISVKTFGFGSSSRTESQTTLWLADGLSLKDMMNPFVDASRNLSSMFAGNSEWEKIVAGPSRELPNAAALKMRSTSTTTSEKGQIQHSVSSMQVDNWSRGDVNAADLEIPSGFKAVEMPDMAALSDSMKAAGIDTLDLRKVMKDAGYDDEDIASVIKQSAIDGAKDQAKQEAREAGREAVRQGVGRLLRRRP